MRYAKLVSYCQSLPNATSERKWRNTLVFMVAKKMFALFIIDKRDKPIELWCKVDDEVPVLHRPTRYPASAVFSPGKVDCDGKNAMTDAMAQQVLCLARDIIFMKLPKRMQNDMRIEDK